MRLFLMIEGQEGVTWDDWVALARTAEESGLDGLFRSDHYASTSEGPRDSLDAWATLAALAAITERIRLGTLVSPATFRHPSVLAKSVATVDHVSGGRVELGLGAGWMELEHRAYGFPFPPMRERLEVFAEQLEIVKRQWTEESVDFEGRRYRLENCRALPRPLQDPHPTLLVGGTGTAGTIEPAVRFADEYNTFYFDVEGCRRVRSRLDEACGRAGRDPATLPLSLMTGLVVAPDGATLERRAARVAELNGNGSWRELAARPEWIVGTADEVADRLRELENAGVTRLMAQHLAHDDLESVELMAAELQPALA
jgi:F420-dependent oxidoreductase-like protein